MFDLAAGNIDRPFHDKHSAPTILSIAAHAVVMGAVIGTFLFTVTGHLPEVPTIMAFAAELPAPSPPPPPPPSAARPPEVQAARTVPAPDQTTLAAPAETPTGINAKSDIAPEVEGGVEGGVPGGIAGGVLGGLITEAPSLPPPPKPAPIRVGGNIQTPRLIHRVEPAYPPIAVSAKVTGVVILEATVDEKGAVTNVAVLRSLSVLDQAAIDAVKQWRYEPLLMNGAPFPFILTVTLNFSLR